ANPKLDIFDGNGTNINTNDDWHNNPPSDVTELMPADSPAIERSRSGCNHYPPARLLHRCRIERRSERWWSRAGGNLPAVDPFELFHFRGLAESSRCSFS